MKQIHLRLEDDVHKKLVEEAVFLDISLNQLIVKRITDSEITLKSNEKDMSKLYTEIHKDLTDILIELNNQKMQIFDIIHKQNNSENLSEAEQNLAKSITNTKQEVLKQLLKMQKKIK